VVNIGFGEEITQEVHFVHLIWSSVLTVTILRQEFYFYHSLNRLDEAIPTNGHNIGFGEEITQ